MYLNFQYVSVGREYTSLAAMYFQKAFKNKKKVNKILPRRNCKAKTPLNQLECDSAIGLLTLTLKS